MNENDNVDERIVNNEADKPEMQRLENDKNPLSNTYQYSGYAGLQDHISDHLRTALEKIVLQHGMGIFRNAADLEKKLIQEGCSKIEIYQVLILINVPGFSKLIGPGQLLQVDINNFVTKAYQTTGMLKPLIISMMSVIIEKKEQVWIVNRFEALKTLDEKRVFVVPYDLYQRELNTLESSLEAPDVAKYLEGKTELTDAVRQKLDAIQQRLNVLVKTGIPRAKYMRGLYFEEDKTSKNPYILEAALEGDDEAVRELGRRYFNEGHWKKAYESYFTVGAGYLYKEDMDNISKIEGQKELNKKVMVYNLVLFMITLIISILFPHFGGAGQTGAGAIVWNVLMGIYLIILPVIYHMDFYNRKSMYCCTSIGFIIWVLSMLASLGI